jgi:DNA-binding response OmpR family regulator
MDKIKVLLVDDEEDFVKALAERIKMRDLDGEIALNGEQALQIVDNQIPDVMVLDLRMPGIDGMEVLRRVKKQHPQVQVIILTGHGSEKDESIARDLGAYEYHQKPVDIDVLVKTLKGAYEKVKAYEKSMEDTMVAATFAQAGEFDTAKELIKKK